MFGSMAALFSSPLILLLIGVIVLMVLVKQKKKVRPEPSQAMALEFRSSRDSEIEEDAALIASHYRDTAKSAYVKAALDRHREQLVDADSRESTFRSAINAWANDTGDSAPKKTKS